MKKNLFMVAAVALMAFTACNKEEFNYGAGAPVGSIEFTAGFEAETKTTLVDGKTAWSEGDEISINGVKFTAQQSGLTSTFVNAEVPQGEFKAPFTAIYPYSETAGVAEVAATQTVSSGTFADDVVVSVAYAEDGNNLTFRHVSSVIKFQVATEGVEELVFSSSTADLAGTINVNTDASYIVKSGSKTITVRPSNGTFKTTETYYVSVLPTIGEGKVDFSVKLDKNEAKSGNVSFAKNTIMDAGKFAIPRFIVKGNGVWQDYNLYTWNSAVTPDWPGNEMAYSESGKFYYFDLPLSEIGKKISFIVNNGSCKTGDSDAVISETGYTYTFPVCKIFVAKPKTGFNLNDAFYNVYFYTVSQSGTPQFPTNSWRGKQMTYSHDDANYYYYYLEAPVPNGQKIKYRFVGNGNAEINADPDYTHDTYAGFTYYLNNDNVKSW